jgi:hypothetical protein
MGFGELSLINSGGKSLGCRKWCVALRWLHVIAQSSLMEDWSWSWWHLAGCRWDAFVVPAYHFWAVWTQFTQQPRLLIGRSLRRSASWISQLTLSTEYRRFKKWQQQARWWGWRCVTLSTGWKGGVNLLDIDLIGQMIRCFFFYSTSRAESKNWIFNLCISKPLGADWLPAMERFGVLDSSSAVGGRVSSVVRKNRASQPNCRSRQPAHNWQILYKKT